MILKANQIVTGAAYSDFFTREYRGPKPEAGSVGGVGVWQIGGFVIPSEYWEDFGLDAPPTVSEGRVRLSISDDPEPIKSRKTKTRKVRVRISDEPTEPSEPSEPIGQTLPPPTYFTPKPIRAERAPTGIWGEIWAECLESFGHWIGSNLYQSIRQSVRRYGRRYGSIGPGTFDTFGVDSNLVWDLVHEITGGWWVRFVAENGGFECDSVGGWDGRFIRGHCRYFALHYLEDLSRQAKPARLFATESVQETRTPPKPGSKGWIRIGPMRWIRHRSTKPGAWVNPNRKGMVVHDRSDRYVDIPDDSRRYHEIREIRENRETLLLHASEGGIGESIVRMRLGGMIWDEIARTLGIPRSTAEHRFQRIAERARTMMIDADK